MKRVAILTMLLLMVACGVAAVPRDRKGVLGVQTAGQQVSLKEKDGTYQISVLPGVPQGHRVVEVGADYVVVEDVAGVHELRIPIYAVRSVNVFKGLQRQQE